MASERTLDVICIGRSSVDLYSQQPGGGLEDMASLAKSAGGSPTNIGIEVSHLGLQAVLVTRVWDEHMGRLGEVCRRPRHEMFAKISASRLDHSADPAMAPDIFRHVYDLGVFPCQWNIEPDMNPDYRQSANNTIDQHDSELQGAIVPACDWSLSELWAVFIEEAHQSMIR